MTRHSRSFAIDPARADALFEEVGTAFFALLDQVGGLRDQTVTIAELVGPEGSRDLIAQNRVIERFLSEVKNDVGNLSDLMAKLNSNASRLRALLRTQSSDLRMAAMVATNARVVSSTIADSDGSLAYFAEKAQRLMNEAVERIGALQGILITADEQLQDADPLIRRFGDDVRTLMAHGARLPSLIEALPTTQLEQAAKQNAQALTLVARSLDTATAQLQMGDAVRQRLEHAAQISDQAKGHSGAAKQAVMMLAEAQKTSALSALADAATDILPELEHMTTHWSAVSRAMTLFADPKLDTDIGDVARVLDRIVAGSQALVQTRNDIATRLDGLVDTYATVLDHLQSATEFDREMGLLSINTILASGRIGDQGNALMEVSRQLRETTGQIGRQGGRIGDLSQDQEGTISAIGAQHLNLSDQAYQAALARNQDAVGRLADALRALSASAVTVHQRVPFPRLQDQLSKITTLKDAGSDDHDDFFQLIDEAPEIRDICRDIRSLYTMSAEREVHDALIGHSLDASEAATPEVPPPTGKAAQLSVVEDVFF